MVFSFFSNLPKTIEITNKSGDIMSHENINAFTEVGHISGAGGLFPINLSISSSIAFIVPLIPYKKAVKNNKKQ